MIHPAGLGGRPVPGHRCSATTNASCGWMVTLPGPPVTVSGPDATPEARSRFGTLSRLLECVDACEERCLKEIRQGLRSLGAREI